MINSAYNLAILALAGMAQASFAWPMKHFRGWRWEHVWVGQALTSNILYPCLLSACLWPAFRPHLSEVTPERFMLLLGMGVAWGLGGVGYGMSVALLGLSFTYSVLFSITILSGALLPLVARRASLPHYPGLFALALGLCVLGTVGVARAGARRQRRQSDGIVHSTHLAVPLPPVPYAWAVLSALVAGVLSAAPGLALSINEDLVSRLACFGFKPLAAPMVVWLPIYFGCALVNLSIGLAFACQGRSLRFFWEKSAGWNWALVHLMGILGFGGFLLYGMGASRDGHPPKNIAWAIYMTFFVIAGNAIGALTGEWQGSARRTYAELSIGVTLLLCAIVGLAVA